MVRHRKNRGFGNEKSFEGKAASGIRKAWAEFIFGKFTFLRRFTIHHSPFTVSLVVAVAVLGLCFAVPAYSQNPKLIVKDSSNNTKFVVMDDGFTGIGTATPQNELHLNLSAAAAGTALYSSNAAMAVSNDSNSVIMDGIVADNTGTSGYRAALRGVRARGTLAAPIVPQTNDYVFSLIGGVYDGAAVRNPANISFIVDGAVSSNVTPERISFSTSTNGTGYPVERMTVKNNGFVGIGTSNPTHLIQLSGGAYSDGATWVNASSRALKENIKDLSAGDAMAAFTKLEPVTFNYRADKTQGHVGFIAEDVPALVAMKDRKGLSALDIVGVLTKVVQEQQKTITELTARVNKLQQEMNAKGVVALGIK
jgi:Chaperone of endosialidase